MRTVDICLSPDLLHLYDVTDKVVVVVDILRATSCMTTGIAFGLNHIKPVANLADCRGFREQGYYIAGERNGQKVEGFDLGNSPFDYMDGQLMNQKVAVTTTNGTRAIELARESPQVIIGSFLNISAVTEHLIIQKLDVLILCAGWKGKVNLEDTLFAGALSAKLRGTFVHACDAPIVAEGIYDAVKGHMLQALNNSSHVIRLKKLGIQKDIAFCLKTDEYDIVPVLKDDKIVAL